jgi:hypothetical protein
MGSTEVGLHPEAMQHHLWEELCQLRLVHKIVGSEELSFWGIRPDWG